MYIYIYMYVYIYIYYIYISYIILFIMCMIGAGTSFSFASSPLADCCPVFLGCPVCLKQAFSAPWSPFLILRGHFVPIRQHFLRTAVFFDIQFLQLLCFVFIFKILLTFTFISKLETMGKVLPFISFLFCSFVLLERYSIHLGCGGEEPLTAPVQDQLSPSWTTFWRPAPRRLVHACFSGIFFQ